MVNCLLSGAPCFTLVILFQNVKYRLIISTNLFEVQSCSFQCLPNNTKASWLKVSSS